MRVSLLGRFDVGFMGTIGREPGNSQQCPLGPASIGMGEQIDVSFPGDTSLLSRLLFVLHWSEKVAQRPFSQIGDLESTQTAVNPEGAFVLAILEES